jgi:predicted transcriptional regulator
MNSQLLIDAIVRQTMVLIAQLSTVDGVRSPLSHVADSVFVNLVRELESQGLGKKVIADMFGLALRSYRQKVQRLNESVTDRGISLWEAIHAFLAEHESVSRAEILRRFKRDDEATVRSILNDLVESGLVLRSGRGKDAKYRVATAEELEELGVSSGVSSQQTNEALVWVHIYRAEVLRKDRLAQLLALPDSAIDQAVNGLLADERIRTQERPDGVYYSTDRCLIPVGEAAGWEAAVVDHHRAVLCALGAKAVEGRHVSAADDTVGGTTLAYDIWPGHPKEQEVRSLLADTRERVIALWDEVEEYNRTHESEAAYRVTFYCGQYLREEEDDR